MSNKSRNIFVVETNEISAKINKIINLIDNSLDNIAETERNTMFEISYDLKQKGIDLWNEKCILREALIIYFNKLISDALNVLITSAQTKPKIFKNKEKILKKGIKYYLDINEKIKNYDYQKNYYQVLQDYCAEIVPTDTRIGLFQDIYNESSKIAKKINANETEKYSDLTFLELMTSKENESKRLKRFKEQSNIETDGLSAIIELIMKNDLETLKKYDKKITELEEKDIKKLHF